MRLASSIVRNNPESYAYSGTYLTRGITVRSGDATCQSSKPSTIRSTGIDVPRRLPLIFVAISVVATAILDRLLHLSQVITIRGDSYRLREKRRSGLIKSASLAQGEPA